MSVISSNILAGASGAAGGDKVYVDDVFSTYLYEGSSSTQTITNGIDLSGEGGLVWIKNRDNARQHSLYDSERPLSRRLSSNKMDGEETLGANGTLTFNSNGVSIPSGDGDLNGNFFGSYVAWTFRKQKGFLDIVTYSGSDSVQTIPHSLGSEPGMILIKNLTSSVWWAVYHRSLATNKYLRLNTAESELTSTVVWNQTRPTSTEFTVGVNGQVSGGGNSFVAYIFAHDDAQFGTGGDESIIKCGSYTGTGSTQTIDFGFEPQWVMIKMESRANTGQSGGADGNWIIFDNLRGVREKSLYANTSATEANYTGENHFTSNGITLTSSNDDFNDNYRHPVKYIYMAIRRPNKPPEVATDVFNVISSATPRTAVQRPEKVDMYWFGKTGGFSHNLQVADRLRGFQSTSTNSDDGYTTPTLVTNNGNQERTSGNAIVQQDYSNGPFVTAVSSGSGFINYMFKRAPGFMDVVTFSGTGSNLAVNHNLAAIPELILHKNRTSAVGWIVSTTPLYSSGKVLNLSNNSGPYGGGTNFMTATPTASQISLSSSSNVVNASGNDYVQYLFATLPGISKVGSYTGTGNAINIPCGFTNGARFIMIKRIDEDVTGDWYVWDSVRGIVSGNDPYLLLNVNTTQVTNTDYVDPNVYGFTVTASAPAALNASGGTYLFLAIA